jgi:hypothetical protein
MLLTLPVLMTLSWMPALPVAQVQAGAAQAPAAAGPAPAAERATITCPLTGEQIPACCCPVKQKD